MKQKRITLRYRAFSRLLLWVSCMMLTSFSVQGAVIEGKVVDATTEEPLIGVSVKVKSGTEGTVTDIDGNFRLSLTTPKTLEVSYIGYIAQELMAQSGKPMLIKLREDVKGLEEVIVIGYGTQKKQDLTGAVSVVDMKEASKLVTSSISEKLQGQAAGVSVRSSGDPGSMGSIRIRGVGSFSNVGPLYVVDGLIVNDVNHVNPSDIESMQILKDASSTAIYGSRGANGVIIITTKRGKEGRPRFELTANFGVQELAKKLEMKSTADFLYYNELAYLNAGKEWPAELVAGQTLPNSDFQRELFQTGTVQDYNMSFTAGTDKMKMMMGA